MIKSTHGIISSVYKAVIIGGLAAIPFPTTSGSGFTESPPGRFGPGIGYAVSNLSFAANAVGWVQMEYATSANQDAILGIDTDNNTLTTYDNAFDGGIGVRSSNANYGYILNGSFVGIGVNATDGSIIRVYRDATMTITADYSTNGGTSWINMFNYGTYAGQLWVKAHVISGSHYLLNPKHSGLT